MKLFRVGISNTVIAFVLFWSCIGSQNNETKIIIYHTNDSHAQINNFPALAALVANDKIDNPHVFLVSSGDIFSGNPLVDYYDPPGYPKIDLMNKLGYLVHTMGNHEFDYGKENLKARMEQADFPFIIANMEVNDPEFPQPKPYLEIKAGKIKIAFLGLLEVNRSGIPSTHPKGVKGFTFHQPIATAGEYAFLAKDNDAVVALSHHGFKDDKAMAELYPWMDVIIGGHDHTLVKNAQKFNDVLITQAGDDLQYAGKVTLVFDRGNLVERRAEMISLSDIKAVDSDVANLVSVYNDNPVLNTPIANVISPMAGKDALGCFFTDALRWKSESDFAFQNNGGIRINKLEGAVSMMDLYSLDPFGNQVVTINMSYVEMQGLIRNSMRRNKTPELQISGGSFEVKLNDKGNVSKVIIFDINGKELLSDKTYKVATNSYIASAFNFKRKDAGKSWQITTVDCLIEYAKYINELDYANCKRSKVTR